MTTVAAGLWATHGGHIVFIAGPMVLLALFAAFTDVRRWMNKTRSAKPAGARRGVFTFVAAAMSVAAGVTHGVVCPEHFREATIYGVFFLVAASCQLSWAVLVLIRPSRFLWAGALVGNASIVALWAVTRSVGVPLGPGAGEKEAIGALDIVATCAEVGLVVCCALALRQLSARGTSPDAPSGRASYPEDDSARTAAGATLLK